MAGLLPPEIIDRRNADTGEKAYPGLMSKATELLNVVDLVAGSLAHFYDSFQDDPNTLVKEGADKTLQWLASQGTLLKKLNLVIVPNGENKIKTRLLNLQPAPS